MRKVLILNTVGMGYEGISSVILNYIEHMNRTELSFTIMTCPATPPELKTRIQKSAEIYCIPKKKKNPKGYLQGLLSVMRRGYDVIHIHGNSGMMLPEVLLARQVGIKKIIVHCHNTTCDHLILNKVMKHPMKLLATDLVACSKAAGRWLYGTSSFMVLNNAIDLAVFSFCEKKRTMFRKKFGIGNEFVIGHIGHFTWQKNHTFLIDIFAEYHKRDAAAKLLLLSDGPRWKEIQKKVRRLHLEDNVIFAGGRWDAAEIYSAMDMFLLPSLWEGLPFVMLEAQANGLPLLVSDVITQDAKCTERTVYFDLNRGAAAWAEQIQKIRALDDRRLEDVTDAIRNRGFDIRREADVLREIYLS